MEIYEVNLLDLTQFFGFNFLHSLNFSERNLRTDYAVETASKQ